MLGVSSKHSPWSSAWSSPGFWECLQAALETLEAQGGYISIFLWVCSLKKKQPTSSRNSQSSPSTAVPFCLQTVEWQVCSCFLVHVALVLLVIHANIYPCWSSNGSVSESLNRWPFTKTQESQSSQFSLETKDSQQIRGTLQSQSKTIHFSSLCHICHVSASRKCSCSRIILNKSPVTCQAWLTPAALLCNHQWFTLFPPLCLNALWGHWNMLLCQSKILNQRARSLCVMSLTATSDLFLTGTSCLPLMRGFYKTYERELNMNLIIHLK